MWLLLLIILLPTIQAWNLHNQECLQITDQGSCYLNETTFSPSTLPCNLSSTDEPNVAVQSIQNWFKIRDFRQQELQHYTSHVIAPKNRPLQIVLDGSCTNKLDVANKWIIVGGNILRPWIGSEMKTLLNGTRINTVVMLMSYWSSLSLKMQQLVVKHIHQHLISYGRFVLIGNGEITRTTDDFQALLKLNGFAMRQYSLNGNKQDEGLELHLGLSRIWTKTIVISATKLPTFTATSATTTTTSTATTTTATNVNTNTLQSLCDDKKTSMCSTHTYVVNLNRRPNRWTSIQQTLQQAGLQPNVDFERFAAVDGSAIYLTPDLKHLFRLPELKETTATTVLHDQATIVAPYDSHGFRPGVLGCAMSNIKIWRDLVNDRNAKDNDFVIVLEDDIWFLNSKTFLSRWKIIYSTIVDDDRWNWLYLGFSSNQQSALYGDIEVAPGIQQFPNVKRSFGGGTFGYVMRRRGATFLLDRAQKHGISQAIDWFMMDNGMGGVKPGSMGSMAPHVVYKLAPMLILTTPVLQLNVSDTTQSYPADLRIEEASKFSLLEKARVVCGTDNSNKKINSPAGAGNGGGVGPGSGVVLGSDNSSGGSLSIPMRISVSTAPKIVTRPSFRWKMELELAQIGVDGNHLIQKHQCDLMCFAFHINNVQLSKNCREMMRSGHDIILPVPLSLGATSFNQTSFTIDVWIEDRHTQQIISNGGIARQKIQVVDMVSLFITNNANKKKNEKDSKYVLAHATSIHIEYVVNGAADFSLHQFAPELYVLCGRIDSPLFATPGNTIDLGCDVLRPTLDFSNLPFGKHQLTLWLQSLDGATFGHVHNHTIHAVPVLLETLVKEKKNINKQHNENGNQDNNKIENKDAIPNHQLTTCTPPTIQERFQSFNNKDNLLETDDSFDLLVLLYRNAKAFRASLVAWKKSGLLKMATNRYVFNNGKALSPEDQNLLISYNMTQIENLHGNIGIGRAVSKLVHTSTSKYILFLEEDWTIENPLLVNVPSQITTSMKYLRQKQADIVKLRSAMHPGHPYCSAQWKGYEQHMNNTDVDRLASLNAASWMTLQERQEIFEKDVWSNKEMVCSFASRCGWTNNPFMTTASFLRQAGLLKAMESDWTTRIEASINLTPYLWSTTCHTVCQFSNQGKKNPNETKGETTKGNDMQGKAMQGETEGNDMQGIFTHDDLDQPFRVQSPCGKEPGAIQIARQHQTDQWINNAKQAAASTSSENNIDAPIVTILVPVYNGATHGYLRESVTSAVYQSTTIHNTKSHFNIEVICINDGSKDETLAVLHLLEKEFQTISNVKFKVLNSLHNIGLPAALNLGLKQATGEYITWTSSDNVMERNMLSILYSTAMKYPEVDLFFGDWNMVEPNRTATNTKTEEEQKVKHVKNEVLNIQTEDTLKDDDVHVAFSSHDYRTPRDILLRWRGAASFLWKHRGYQFDEQLSGAEDMEMWLRIAEKSKLTVWIYGTSLYTYRLHGGWSGLSLSGKLRKVVTNMAKKTVRRHRDLSLRAHNIERKTTLDPTRLFPSWRMCFDKKVCLGHAYFLLGNAIVDASDREGLRSALFYGLCHYYIEAVRYGGKTFIGARINLALCYVVAGVVEKAKVVAENLFKDIGMDVPWRNNSKASSYKIEKKETNSLLTTGVQKYLQKLQRMLETNVAPRWLDMVTPIDLQWHHDGVSELVTLESELIKQYKVKASTVTATATSAAISAATSATSPAMFSTVIKPRVLVVVPSDPLSAYESAGYGSWLKEYYNPMGYFDAVIVLSPVETGIERQAHGMWIIPLSDKKNAIATFRSIVVRVGASVVRAYGGYWPIDVAVKGTRGINIPVVVSVHDTNPDLVHIDSLIQANQIWPVSTAVATMLHAKYQVPKKQMRMLSNRVNLNTFSQQTISTTTREEAAERAARVGTLAMRYPGKYRLLFIGRRQTQKNWDTVMRTLNVLGDDYVGIFIGKGPRAPMVKYSKEWNVTSQVYLVDTVESEELKYYMWLSDVFCVPSRWEGFGIVFVEAMATGSVVITSNIAPMNEYVDHLVSGLLVKELENEKKLAKVVKLGVHDHQLRKKLQTNAVLAAARFSKEDIDRWEVSLYRMVVGES